MSVGSEATRSGSCCARARLTTPVTPVAERILAALREPMHIDELLIHITGSIGIATFPTDGDRPDELITRADLAMYAAKNAGGDRCLQFSAELGSEAMDTAQLRHDLARAVRSGDFELAYQPIVALESGAVAGRGGPGPMAAPRAAGPGRPVHGVRGEDGPDRRDRTADPRSGGA